MNYLVQAALTFDAQSGENTKHKAVKASDPPPCVVFFAVLHTSIWSHLKFFDRMTRRVGGDYCLQIWSSAADFDEGKEHRINMD